MGKPALLWKYAMTLSEILKYFFEAFILFI